VAVKKKPETSALSRMAKPIDDDAMQTRPATAPTDDIVTATTREGYDLPVIDVTHPRFAVSDEPQAARALHEAFVAAERGRAWIPKFIMRLMLRSAAKKSRLVRAIFEPEGAFLDGLSTYVMKLGPDNLVPPYDAPIDRRFAASPHVGLLRLRMQQTARLLADGLIDDLSANRDAPLHLINIGGGPALDSVNALILLRRGRADLLKRPIVIHVLDGGQDGPFFGANALAALKADGQPLHGLDITWDHRDYDWNDPAMLTQLVRELAAAGAIVAASSEGALFEYGTDDAIVANLKALRAGGAGAKLVAGSVTRADEFRQRMIAQTRFKLFPRGLAGFAPLAARAGFVVARSETAWLSDQVLLRPAA
jgi:hypothetical protein